MPSLPALLCLLIGASAPADPGSATPDPPPAADDSSADRSSRREARRDRVEAARRDTLARSYRQRTLGQHPFVRPQFVTSALPTSHFGLTAGAGAVFDHAQDPSTALLQRGSYFAGTASADAGVRIGKWVGFNAALAGLTGVGRNPDVLLDVGAAAAYSWQGSVIVRALQRETTALSFRPQMQGLGARGLVLHPGFDALKDQVQNGENIDLVEAARHTATQDNAMRGLLHVALAQSMTRFVGLQVGVAGGGERQRRRFYNGDAQDVRSARGLFQSGLALSVDTHPIPLALLAEYNFNLAIGTGAQRGELAVSHDVGGGLYLNALTQTLGVSVAANLAQGRQTLVTTLSFRGYF